MNILLFDDPTTKQNLLPLTYTRPTSEIRVGILTIKEKWEKWLPADYSYFVDEYLSDKFQAFYNSSNLFLNGAYFPNQDLVEELRSLKKNQLLKDGDSPIAFYGKLETTADLDWEQLSRKYELVQSRSNSRSVNFVYDIFRKNRDEIISDFHKITFQRESAPIEDPHTVVYNKSQVFIEENVSLRSAIINAESGPVYLGANSTIGEASIIRGASAVGAYASLNLGTKIRGDSTIGPYSKVGGEVANSVLFAYSSKAHAGYLGNSVIGEWCNLGADTNTSNLKNNYKPVKVWNYRTERFMDSGLQFCGLIMGDHSKCGINTMFNTGTIVGVSANIFGSGFPRTFIPSFSWGGAAGFTTYRKEQAMEVMKLVMQRRNKSISGPENRIIDHIFEASQKYRKNYP